MDHPQFDHHEIYDQNGNGYNPDEYGSGGYNSDYNGTGYGGTQFLLDTKIYYLFIGVILYTSCCFLRNRSRIREVESDLNVPINNSKIIEKIKKNIVPLENIDKSTTCSICLEEFNSEKEIAILDLSLIHI